MEYPKIETLYDRNDKFKVDPTQIRLQEFSLINSWWITEKVDGTNVRVMWNYAEKTLKFGGRTDNAQMQTSLLTYLQDTFHPEQFAEYTSDVILFGEGYGEKIQNGGGYRKGVSFRLFDVLIGKWWLEPFGIKGIADYFKIETVPFLRFIYALPKTKEDLFHCCGIQSLVTMEDGGQGCLAEGIVARTVPGLLCRNGKRLMWKLKFKDF